MERTAAFVRGAKSVFFMIELRRVLAVSFFLFLCLFATSRIATGMPRRVVYGMVELRPLFFRDELGAFRGFFVDLLQAVAGEEGWDLAFVSAPGERLVSRLASGEIDLASMTPTPRLTALFDFSKIAHYGTWFTIFMHPGESFLDILDLRGRTIAAQRGFIGISELRKIAEQLKMDVPVLDFATIGEAFDAVSKGHAHGVLAEYAINLPLARKHHLLRTPLVFSPSRVFFATTKGRNPDLLAALDRRLSDMIGDAKSPYYTFQRRWLYDEDLTFIPNWTYWAFGIGLLVLLVFTCGIIRIARTSAALRSRQRELSRLLGHETAVSEIARILLSHRGAEDVLSRTCVRLREASGSPWCAIVRIVAREGGKTANDSARGQCLHVIAESRDVPPHASAESPTPARLPVGRSLLPFIDSLKEGKNVLLGRDAILNALPDVSPGNAHTFLFLPVSEGRTIWGTLGVASVQPDFTWDEETLRLLRTTADMAGAFLRIRSVESELRKTSEVDPLTGIMNRHAFLETLRREISRSLRHGYPLVLAIADLDHFKEINDTFGHDTGDLVLMDVAQAIREELRAEDRVGRLDGEEFGILMPESFREDAQAALERIRLRIESLSRAGGFVGNQRSVASPKISIGFTLFRGRDDSSQSLYRRADQALYRAKAAGGNGILGD
jgi:diguanylate cyclase (GGDEF)-like protein